MHTPASSKYDVLSSGSWSYWSSSDVSCVKFLMIWMLLYCRSLRERCFAMRNREIYVTWSRPPQKPFSSATWRMLGATDKSGHWMMFDLALDAIWGSPSNNKSHVYRKSIHHVCKTSGGKEEAMSHLLVCSKTKNDESGKNKRKSINEKNKVLSKRCSQLRWSVIYVHVWLSWKPMTHTVLYVFHVAGCICGPNRKTKFLVFLWKRIS